MPGALEGYRVVELAEGTAGPYAAMALGDAGADVVKIERPGGDRARGWGSGTRGDLGAAFLNLNRSKRGIALDIDTDEGAAAARRLIARADVVIADAGWATHADLQPDALLAAHPQLVYCHISQDGDQGPQADRPPYGELAAQLASEASTSLGRMGEAPVRMGTDPAAMYAGIYSVQAICAALYARDTAGGQRIDVSLLGCMVTMRSTLWAALSNPDEWWGFHLDSYVKPVDHGYHCKDGSMLFALRGITDEQREQLYVDLDMQWVKDDPLFDLLHTDTGGGAGRYSHVVHSLWERAFANFTVAELSELLQRYGGWVYPKNDYEMLVNHPQVEHLGMVQAVEHPGIGPVRSSLSCCSGTAGGSTRRTTTRCW